MPFTPLNETPQARGFVPLEQSGFVPLQEPEPAIRPGEVFRNLALNNPLTAAVEAGLNVGSQMIALPVAGIAGIGAAATHAVGATDREADDVVRAVGSALTYQPRGEMGKAAAGLVAVPFEKLAEAGEHAGDKVLDATGSPAAATAVDTAVNALPMLLSPVRDAGRNVVKRIKGAGNSEPSGFVPIEVTDGRGAREAAPGAERVAGNGEAVHRAAAEELEAVRRGGDRRAPAMADELSAVPGRPGATSDAAALARQDQYGGELSAGERGMGAAPDAEPAAPMLPQDPVAWRGDDGHGGRPAGRGEYLHDGNSATGSRVAPGVASEEALSRLGLDRVQGRDAAAPGMGETAGPDGVPRLGADPERLGGGAGVDTAASTKGARYALIEADDLRASHDESLRPVGGNPFGRQATPRAENEAAVQSIVQKFDPARLVESVDDASGAPIVARDGVVETGQRRAIALKRVYQANGHKAEMYREQLRTDAQRLGLDSAAVDSMRKPVLVRLPDEAAPRHGLDIQAMDPVQNAWAPGANYVPLIDDSRAPVAPSVSVEGRAKPITREEVLAPFLKALDLPIYEGRVKGKRLGWYMPKRETLRIKKKSDLEVAAHEIAHAIDDRIPEIRETWSKGPQAAAIAKELKAVSYDQANVREGFAEFMRLYLTQPEEAARRAPTFNAWVDGFTQRHPYGKAILKAREGMTTWFGQDGLDRARSKIGTRKQLNESLSGLLDRFRQATVDDLHGLYRMERNLSEGKIEAAGAYETARLTRAAASMTDGAIRWGAPYRKADGSFGYRGAGLEKILKPVAERLDDFLLYAVGRSARELMMQGRENLFSKGEIKAMVALETPEFRKAFADYQAWNKGILDFAEDLGILNAESRALWRRNEYLPFYRDHQGMGGKGSVEGDWRGVHKLTGGTGNLRDILGNITQNASMMIAAALKNEARAKVVALAEGRQGGGKFLTKIPADSMRVKVNPAEVLDRVLRGMGIDRQTHLPADVQTVVDNLTTQVAADPQFFDYFTGGGAPKGGNLFAVMHEGKPTYYEVADPLLMRSMTALTRPAQLWVVRMLGMPKRIGQASITTVPEFWIANMARDTIMGGIMTRGGFRPIIDSLRGMRDRFTNDPAYQDFVANGGGLSSLYLDETRFKADLRRFYARKGIDSRTVIDAPEKLLNLVETIGDAFEISTRLGEYRRAVEAGENPRHAAYRGREVSTDFAMRGDSQALGFLYDTVMFLKPAVLSMDRLARGLAHDPNRGAIAAKAGLLAMFSMGLYLLNRDNPKYQDLPDWDRDSYWHFFVGNQHFRYPKIWEIGALSSAAERSLAAAMDDDSNGLGNDLSRIVGATFNLNLMPQVIAPLAEQKANRNSFTGAPIETPGMENLQPAFRAKPTTSETMKALGMATSDLPESLQFNPVRGEALLRGYLNTWAMYGLMLTDKAFFGDRLPEKRTDELPVVRRFYAQEPPRATKYESQLYDMLTEAQRLRGTMRYLDTLGRSDIADGKEREPLAGKVESLERAQRNLQIINRDMAAVRMNGVLSPAEKRSQLDALTAKRNALLKAAVTETKAAMKEKQ